MHKTVKVRGVRGAASCCAAAAIVFLLARNVLTLLVNFCMGLAVSGATLHAPVGFSGTTVCLLQIIVSLGAVMLPLGFLLTATRLRAEDLRITVPAPWSPAFCLVIFLGIANAANLFGGLLSHLFGLGSSAPLLPSGGVELLLRFLQLCLLPAVTEELFFRGAMQGLLRPCGSAAAIFGPALLFGLLHGSVTQVLTGFVCGIFLGWLAERSGSILPGMALHFVNNVLAFLAMYLQFYAPAALAQTVQWAILLVFPLAALFIAEHAYRQGFRFSQGLRPGVEAWEVFSGPAYTLAVAFLTCYSLFFLR